MCHWRHWTVIELNIFNNFMNLLNSGHWTRTLDPVIGSSLGAIQGSPHICHWHHFLERSASSMGVTTKPRTICKIFGCTSLRRWTHNGSAASLFAEPNQKPTCMGFSWEFWICHDAMLALSTCLPIGNWFCGSCGLVVESMSAALWDSCFWSVNAPNCFAALIHWFDDDFENPGPSPEQKAGPSPEEQSGPSPEKAADVKQKHQLMKLLSDLRERWNCIFIVEKLLFKKIPTDSADVQEQFQESANEHPALAKWYYFLDGVTDQLTREIVAILSSWSWGIQALRDHVLQARLRHTFAAPSSTKTWNEDVFRDLRASYVNVPDSRVSCWSRQKQSMVSLQNRDRKLIMPVLNSGHASRRSQQAFQNFQHKKLVTNSIFSPATNPAKAKRCQEQGRKFDCGYATKTGLNPLIDLKPLVSPGQGQAQQKKVRGRATPCWHWVFVSVAGKQIGQKKFVCSA